VSQEASLKSNKRESMPGDASSALEMEKMEGALKKLNLTP
jgi:hypothetical protein